MADEPKPFAKLFDTEFGQLLVTTEWDDEADTYGICFRLASFKGVVPECTFGGWATEEEAERALADTDQARADEAAAMLRGAVKQMAA